MELTDDMLDEFESRLVGRLFTFKLYPDEIQLLIDTARRTKALEWELRRCRAPGELEAALQRENNMLHDYLRDHCLNRSSSSSSNGSLKSPR